jgi:starch synthase
LSRNAFFAQLLEFVTEPPSSEGLSRFMRQLPSSSGSVATILQAMFVAARQQLDSSGKLVEIKDDDIIGSREDKLILLLKAMRDHPDRFIKAFGENLIEMNMQGTIMFVAPELGPFSKVGGLSTMVWELTKELVQLGLDIHVVSPYYNVNSKGEQGYLAKDGIEYKFNIDIFAPESTPIGVHFGVVDGVKCWDIHHFQYFAVPYQTGSSSFKLKTLVIMARAPLELCCQIRLFPSVIVTNDWITACWSRRCSSRRGSSNRKRLRAAAPSLPSGQGA